MRFEVPAPGRPQAWLRRSLGFWFDSLQGRFTLAMLAGLLIVQLLVNLLWYRQAEQRVRRQAEQAAHHVASGVLGALRALRELPAPYRPLLIEQLRTMGGTRFLVFLNDAEVPTEGLPDLPLARSVEQGVHEQLSAQLAPGTRMQVVLASPQGLRVAPGGTLLADLPDSWIDPSLLASERPASFVVVQVETEPGHWLYLTSAIARPLLPGAAGLLHLATADPAAADPVPGPGADGDGRTHADPAAARPQPRGRPGRPPHDAATAAHERHLRSAQRHPGLQ